VKIVLIFQMDILLNGSVIEEMSSIVHITKARSYGKSICHRLTETIPKHQFQVHEIIFKASEMCPSCNYYYFQISVQAVVGSKVLARDDIKALRKDVSAKLV